MFANIHAGREAARKSLKQEVLHLEPLTGKQGDLTGQEIHGGLDIWGTEKKCPQWRE